MIVRYAEQSVNVYVNNVCLLWASYDKLDSLV